MLLCRGVLCGTGVLGRCVAGDTGAGENFLAGVDSDSGGISPFSARKSARRHILAARGAAAARALSGLLWRHILDAALRGNSRVVEGARSGSRTVPPSFPTDSSGEVIGRLAWNR